MEPEDGGTYVYTPKPWLAMKWDWLKWQMRSARDSLLVKLGFRQSLW